jgi:hypothetical protein
MIKVSEFSKQAREVMGRAGPELAAYRDFPVVGEERGQVVIQDPISKTPIPLEDGRVQKAYQNVQRAGQFMENAELAFNSAFETAFKYGTDTQRKKLLKLSKDYKKANDMLGRDVIVDKKKRRVPTLFTPIEEAEVLDRFSVKLREVTSPYKDKSGKALRGTPQVFTKVEDFVIDRSAETFGNVAFEAYRKFGEKAPILALENIDPERGAITTGEQLRDVVKKTRKEFADKLVSKKGKGRKEAEKIAKKLVGATWDVGHLNQHRKYGMKEEELIAQTEAVAKMVKHVHLTDNFGFSDSHLVPGMGNVPFKQHLEKLEKAGVLDKVKTVVEAGGWANIIKASPHAATLNAFGSPIYGMSQGGGYWNQASGTLGGYFGGYGTINPQLHHSIYGAGLTTLPMELGGAIPGGSSRFSGNSMT